MRYVPVGGRNDHYSNNLEWKDFGMRPIRYFGSKPALIMALAYLWPSVPSVNATVIEFNAEGKAEVTQKEKVTASLRSQPKVSSQEQEQIKDLVRSTALRYSGEAGVRKAGLDALSFIEVFEALIKAESNFNPNALSEKGAQGLGQLMPDTAEDLSVSDPFDPLQNLVGAASYFTNLMAEFGSLELALAAYNAGPQRVRDYKGVPPFRETKKYINTIFTEAGLIAEVKPTHAELVAELPAELPTSSQSNDNEQPLIGETSVWEF